MGFFKDAALWYVGRVGNAFKEGFESALTGESVGDIRRKREEFKFYALFAPAAWDAYKKVRKDLSRRRENGERAGRFEWTEGDVKIAIINGYSYDEDEYTTDVLVMPRDGSGDKLHVVFDEDGNEIVNEWHTK